jgi:hypothetical protein
MDSPDRLRFYIEKRLQTTMIGALSKFENNFGFLWGHNVPEEEELTQEQLEFSDLWETTRNQILNQGNEQIRNLKEDFYRWGGVFKQNFNYSFRVPPQNSDTCSNCKCSKNDSNN